MARLAVTTYSGMGYDIYINYNPLQNLDGTHIYQVEDGDLITLERANMNYEMVSPSETTGGMVFEGNTESLEHTIETDDQYNYDTGDYDEVVLGDPLTFDVPPVKEIPATRTIYKISDYDDTRYTLTLNGETSEIPPYTSDDEVDLFEIRVIGDNVFTDTYLNIGILDVNTGDFIKHRFDFTGTDTIRSVELPIETVKDLSNSTRPPYRLDVDMVVNTEVKQTPDTSGLPMVKMYKVDKEQLDQLNMVELDTEQEKYSDYIMGLQAIPFEVETDVEGNVLIGERSTDIVGGVLPSHVYEYDLGTIHLGREVWGNVSYSNIEVELFTPYFNKIKLDVDEVVDDSIRLALNINLLNGVATLNVYSEDRRYLIHSESKQIGQPIPYKIGERINTEIGSQVLENDVINPYIEVKKQVPDNSRNLNGLHLVKLEDGMYHLKIDTPKLKTSATSEEQEKISRKLTEGVFVRGDYNIENVEVSDSTPTDNSSNPSEQDFWDKWGDHGSLIGS